MWWRKQSLVLLHQLLNLALIHVGQYPLRCSSFVDQRTLPSLYSNSMPVSRPYWGLQNDAGNDGAVLDKPEDLKRENNWEKKKNKSFSFLSFYLVGSWHASVCGIDTEKPKYHPGSSYGSDR